MEHSDDVNLVVSIPIPSLIRQQAYNHATKLLERCLSRFGTASVHMHLKPDGPQVACNLMLKTDEGRYHASSTSWDLRDAILDAMANIEVQVEKRSGRRMTVAAVA